MNNATLVSTPSTPIDSSVALYKCNDGFRHVAGNNTITCHLQEWSRLSIVCHEINCKEAIWLIPNATSTAALTSRFGDTVTYSCSMGYVNTGGNNTSYCQENGEWSKPTIKCKEINCKEALWLIPNATSTAALTSRFGDTVTYSCSMGYVNTGGNNTSYCQENGEWSKPTIKCKEINCKEAIWLIPNATSTAALTFRFGDTVTYSCSMGYINTGGNNTSYCQENGEWSKPTIECKVIQCLENVPIIGNTTTNMTSRNYGDIVTYSCVDGYKYLEGQNTSLCQESGTWSGASIVCAEWQEWGWKVLGFSSQFDESSWHAVHILGKFDVYPLYGDIEGSWAPSDKSCVNGSEWIQVEFAVMLYIRRIDIYETSSAGLVKTLSVERNGTWDIIWTATSVSVIEHSRIFSPHFTTLTFPSNRVMIKTDCTSVVGNWVEFDAIKVFGLTSPPQQLP
ncbi:sushi, von Willebrand factor type A, EGF and pentraxin domain-containing protein 1-like [Haliotis asinina]|uniref:sushi, von Willebrand factor type A, EGF and pentraxin domain-containing protein 1-like n=1 Tax=Haliotis asinina TaxID=109174 RepID=UPI003531A934